MASSSNNAPHRPQELSDEERAAAFAHPRAPFDRSAPFETQSKPIPLRFVIWGVAVFLVLGIGGVLIENNFGGQVTTTSTSTTLAGTPTPTIPGNQVIGSTLSSFIALKDLGSQNAAPFTLQDQFDQPWQLSEARGRAVVLTFFNTNCDDICPVLGTEIKDAANLLGPNVRHVVFAIVNTDPYHYSFNPDPLALRATSLLNASSVRFLTGSLRRLNSVWIDYGISINVGSQPTQMAHNNVMYFIDQKGRLRAQALPFANESRAGVYTLSEADMHRFAQGIVQEVKGLIK